MGKVQGGKNLMRYPAWMILFPFVVFSGIIEIFIANTVMIFRLFSLPVHTMKVIDNTIENGIPNK